MHTKQQHTANDMFLLFQEGEQRIEGVYYELLKPVIFHHAYRMIHDRDEAESIVADVLVIVYDMRKRFDSFNDFQAFLFTCCRNACLNHVQSKQCQQKRNKLVFLPDYLNQVATEEDPGGMDETTLTGYYYQLHQAVDNLAPRRKKVMKSYLRGMKTKDIADSLCLKQSTVRATKKHAIKVLRRKMA